MSRNNSRHRRGWFTLSGVVMSAVLAIVLVAFSGPAYATPGNSGKGKHGQSGEHGNKNGHDNKGKSGNSGNKNSQSNGSSNGHPGGHGNGGSNSSNNQSHSGGHSAHGNSGGNGHQGGATGNTGNHGNTGGGKSDPAGNNGTIKIDGVDFDSHPNNEPHVGCVFQVDFYGFDKGDFDATVTFADHPPTADGGLTVSSGQGNPSSVFIGEDDASGGGSEAGLDASETYTLAFPGEPHPKQGYHVKLTINAPGYQGSDVKHKVFWVQDCGDNPPPPPDDQCPDGTSPGDVDGDGDEDADDCDVIGPPPSSSPLGSLVVNCKGVVTVKLDNRKSTVERTYYLQHSMAPTAAQAWAFNVDGGDVRILTRRGAPGDIFTLSTKNKQLGEVTVPPKCSEPPTNPPSGPPTTSTSPPTTPGQSVSTRLPTVIAAGVAGDNPAGVRSAAGNTQSLGFLIGMVLLLSIGLGAALWRRTETD